MHCLRVEPVVSGYCNSKFIYAQLISQFTINHDTKRTPKFVYFDIFDYISVTTKCQVIQNDKNFYTICTISLNNKTFILTFILYSPSIRPSPLFLKKLFCICTQEKHGNCKNKELKNTIHRQNYRQLCKKALLIRGFSKYDAVYSKPCLLILFSISFYRPSDGIKRATVTITQWLF